MILCFVRSFSVVAVCRCSVVVVVVFVVVVVVVVHFFFADVVLVATCSISFPRCSLFLCCFFIWRPVGWPVCGLQSRRSHSPPFRPSAPCYRLRPPAFRGRAALA